MVSAYAVRLIGKLACLLGLLLLAFGSATSAPQAGQVLALRVDGVIGPATADFIHRGLVRAQAGGYRLVVLELDTPGGLDTSMRAIIKDILASPVPVATYVHPEGARAASAGTYILYASHIAAMTPATNLGAATPVAIGGTPSPAPNPPAGDKAPDGSGKAPDDAMGAKAVNDAAAYLRSLAQLRDRDADFAERAVREAASLSAEEALARGVIDIVAPSLPELLRQLDGREVQLAQGKLRLATAGAAIEHSEPDGRNRFLALLANPQVALILMMIGIYGLFFEFTSPGFIVPGVAGAICLLLALYAFHLLPVNWAGVALIVVGCALMVAEAFAPSFGVLGIGGLIAFIIGGLFLMDGELPGFGVPPALIFGLGVASATILLALGGFAARSRKRPVVSGREEMTGQFATVAGPATDGDYWVQLRGETWRARAAHPLSAGEQVRIDGLDGLTLHVSPSPHTQRSASP